MVRIISWESTSVRVEKRVISRVKMQVYL